MTNTPDSSPIVSLSELFPCPFCGVAYEQKPSAYPLHEPYAEHPRLGSPLDGHCLMSGHMFALQPVLVASWNTRASRPAEGEVEPVVTAQCCMCGKTGLNTVDGEPGDECQLEDGRWTCSRHCYYTAVDWYSPSSPRAAPTRPISPAHGVKELEWSEYPNSFYPDVFGHCWDAQTPFGKYTIEEGSASDSPYYEANFGHSMIAIKDGLPEAKAAAQADFTQRVRSCLTTPADSGSAEVTEEMVERGAKEIAAHFWPVEFAGTKEEWIEDNWRTDVDLSRSILTAALKNGRS